MKIGELYSVMCIIFASNFRASIDEEHFVKMIPSWLIKTENEQNLSGLNEWKKSLEIENANLIAVDFVAIKHCFEAQYFRHIDEAMMVDWFKKTRYEKPFAELKSSHISNMLAFLAAVLRNDKDEKTHAMLGRYLSEYFMPVAIVLAKHLQITAKSHFYRSMGYFLEDFCLVLKQSLGLKS